MNTDPSSIPKADERVTVLVGDRLCVTCGFNLSSQLVVREPHYRMLIVRCPECATVASLQEFPLLGKWATRWGALLAMLWLLVMILFTFATAGAIFGLSTGVMSSVCEPVATAISTAHREWSRSTVEAAAAEAQAAAELERAAALETQRSAQQAILAITQLQIDGQTLAPEQLVALQAATQVLQQTSQPGPIPVPAQNWQGYFGDDWIDVDWWKRQDQASIIATAGRRINADAVRLGIVLALVAFSFGVLWGIALLHARNGRRAVVALLIIAVAACFWVLSSGTSTTTFGGGASFRWMREIAREAAGFWPFVASAILAFVPLFLGMTLGRRIARVMIRLLLPPRLRGPLATLWLIDGLPPPALR